MAMSPWRPTTDPLILRRMGKLIEELGELTSVAGRVIIQGIDEIDPSSGVVNRERLWREMADVIAQCNVTIQSLGYDASAVWNRVSEKSRQMAEWEALLGGSGDGR